MKWIQKQQEPAAFSEWKALANEHWQPRYADLREPQKRAVKQALIQEQKGLCCYCERRLTDRDSHIEHFRPQSDPMVDPLDFANMLCSCQNQLQPGEPRHCGNAKGDWFDETVLLSPLESHCEDAFAYNADGHIQARLSGGRAAEATLSRLALNIPKLRALRAAVIEPFLDETLTETELGLFVNGYLQQDGEGQLSEFYSCISYLFQELVSE